MKELTRRRFALVAWSRPEWWILLAILVAGSVVVATALAGSIAEFPTVLALGVPISLALLTLWLVLLRWVQLNAWIAAPTVAVAVAWGGLVATGLYALEGNAAIITLMGQHLGVDAALEWGPAVAAPLTEEVGKALAIAAVLIVSRERLRTPMDAALIGAYAGAGFAAVENVLYGFTVANLTLGEHEVISTVVIFAIRGVVLGAISHVTFSALVGAGVGWLSMPAPRRRPVLALGAIALGVGLHWLWNSPLPSAGVRLLMVVASPALLWALIVLLRRAEHAWFDEVLRPQEARGELTSEWLARVAPTGGGRRAYRRSLRPYGVRAVESMRAYEAALLDTADAVAQGDEAEAVRHRERAGQAARDVLAATTAP